MGTLIFDIETVGDEWNDIDKVTQTSLLRWTNQVGRNEVEREQLQQEVKTGLGFSPLTGFIVALGIYDLERKSGVVYYSSKGDEAESVSGEYTYKPRSEAEMLTLFWDGARQYDTFVTFNGRRFDVPFIIHRSIVHGIKPTRNLLEGRYPYQQKTCRHVDLQDELTFFGAMMRKPNLHLFCRAYGILSPKEDVCGDDVKKLYDAGRFRDIALYNAKDLTATTALYKKWQDYLDNKSCSVDIDA